MPWRADTNTRRGHEVLIIVKGGAFASAIFGGKLLSAVVLCDPLHKVG